MKATATESMQSGNTYLVIGGSGKTGRRVVERLTARGLPVRAVSRSSTPAFDWHRPEGWQELLDGMQSVYITYSPDLAIPGATAAIQQFVDLAVSQGIERLVLLSGRGEEEAQQCEQIVQRSGVDWTIVRASWFMQNFSEGEFANMVREGVITLPASTVPEPFVDIDDLADVVVAALTDTSHASQVYEVTGPRLLRFDEIAKELSQVSGRDIRFVSIPRQAFVQALEASGAPADIVWLLDYLFETVLDGRNAQLSDGVQRALGRAPADFMDFATRVVNRGLLDANHDAIPAADMEMTA